MRVRLGFQELESRETPSGFTPGFDDPPVPPGGTPGQTPGGDWTFGGTPSGGSGGFGGGGGGDFGGP